MDYKEKAKAYDELLAKAKQIYNKENDVLIIHTIEELFPELAESEDEMIRKWLIGYFNQYIIDGMPQVFGNGLNVKDVIAWLEKQGEKLPVGFYYVNSEGKKFYSDTFKYGDVILHVEKQDKQKPYGQREECLDCQVNYAGECKGSCAMKRDEQKPTDETPYPETLEKAIDLYYYSYGNGKGEFEHLSLEKFRDIVHTFVSDYGQKPAWSEEDELVVKDIEKAIINYWFGQTQEDLLDWIKSIKQRIGE